MSLAKKYYPGFKQEFIEAQKDIFINTLSKTNNKEAILFLHGHPENYLIYRDIASNFTDEYSVVITDLRGYGDSSKPKGFDDHSNYSKRVMAQDQVNVMQKLGFEKFHVVGHDRGARVVYRMLKDHKDKIITACMLDILPTLQMYEQTNLEFASKYWHWFFYIQPKPFAETFLSQNAKYFIENNLLRKATPKAVKMFARDILDDYIRCFENPDCLHGICEDYRASYGIDLEHDKEDLGIKITTPLLVLWGANGVVGNIWNVLEEWKNTQPM